MIIFVNKGLCGELMPHPQVLFRVYYHYMKYDFYETLYDSQFILHVFIDRVIRIY